MDGHALYTTVEEYAAIGDHRTGTPADAETIDWFARALRGRDAHVTVVAFQFDRYEATWSVCIDDVEIESLPVYYSGVGSVRTGRPATGEVRVTGAARGEGLAELASAAVADDRPAAVATTVGAERMTALNRPITRPGAVPIVLVGPDHDLNAASAHGALDVSIDAACVPGSSANVVATLGGATPERPGLVLATPLSGWYRCASERGTGIAVLLALVEEVASRRPVTVIGTSGHELEGEGLQRLLDDPRRAAFESADAIVHLGASVAAQGAVGCFAPGVIRHNVVAADSAIRAALEPLARHVDVVSGAGTTDPARWIGEARHWCPFGVPLLSLTGGSSVFHTTADVPATSTSPALLERAGGAISSAVSALVAAVSG